MGTWPWADVKRAIVDSDGQFAALLGKLPRSEIERLIGSTSHQKNVFGFFEGTTADRARQIYDEIGSRARYGRE